MRPMMGFVQPAQRMAADGWIRLGAALVLALVHRGREGGSAMARGPSRVSPDSTSIVGRPENANVGGLGGASATLMLGARGVVGRSGSAIERVETEMEGTATVIDRTGGRSSTVIDGTGVAGLEPTTIDGTEGMGGEPTRMEGGSGVVVVGRTGLGDTGDRLGVGLLGTTPPIDARAIRLANCSGLSSVIGDGRRGDRAATPGPGTPRSRLRLGLTPAGGRGRVRRAPENA